MNTIFKGVSKSRNIYTLGGTVQAGGGLYISRDADEELFRLCSEGTFAYVLTTRQVGKSSLMVRTAQRLASEGARSVIIDLTQLGKQQTADQWHLGLLTEIARQLLLKTDVTQWWQARQDQGVTSRLTLFLREVVLAEVSQSVVIFIDEIDTTLNLDFTDDFFAAIRSIYNGRAHEPEFQRLSFVLIGVATPNDLIRDPHRTPFNIGRQVNLTDFTFKEAGPLAAGLGLSSDESRQTLEWVLKWTGGHPYLTQRLCRAIAEQGRGNWTEDEVARVVADTFFGERSDQDSNLQAVRDLLTRRAPNISAVLSTYREVRRGRRVPDEEKSLVKSHLKLSGVVVKGKDGELSLRNPIYREVFDEAWIKEHLPVNWPKRLQRAAIGLIATLFLVSTPVAIWAWSQAREAERQRQVAEERRVEADQRRVEAEEQRKIADGERMKAEQQRQNADSARQDAENQGKIAIARGQELKRQLIQTLEDQGRVELLRGNAQSAVVYLNESYQLRNARENNGDNSALQFLLARATQPLQGLAASLNGHESWLFSVAFSKNGKHIVTTGSDRIANIWDAATNTLSGSLKGHTSEIRSANFSPNGKLVATASADSTARVWDVASGAERARLKHDGAVYTAAFSPDGAKIVTASADKTVRVWETATGIQLFSLDDHTDEVNSAVFSPDGRLILSASDDNTAKLWEVTGKKLVASLDGHKDVVYSAAFSPDGKWVVTASKDHTAKVWEVSNGSLHVLLDDAWRQENRVHNETHRSHVHNAIFSPDGRQIVTMSDDGTAKVWDPSNGKLIASLDGHQGRISSVAFNPNDGKYILTTSSDKTAKVWEAATGRLLASLDGHTDTVGAATFSPDGKWVVTASDDKTAKVWDWEAALKGLNVSLKGHKDVILDVSYSPDNQRIITLSRDQTARVWDATGRLIACLAECKARFFSVAFSPDSQSIITGDADGRASLWEAATGKPQHVLEGHIRAGKIFHVHYAVFSPDGERIVTASDDGTAKIWDAATRTLLTTLNDMDNLVQYAAISGNNQRVVTRSMVRGASDGAVEVVAKLWDATNGKFLATLDRPKPVSSRIDRERKLSALPAPATDGHDLVESRRAKSDSPSVSESTNRIFSTAFSPDGRFVVTASDDGTAKIWDAKTGNGLFAIDDHTGWVYWASFSPDSKSLVTANEDGTARLYDVEHRKPLVSFIGHTPHVHYASFSPDGKRVVTASDDGTAKIWDAASGKLLASFSMPQEEVKKAIFTRDNMRLITVGGKSAKIWRVDPEKRSPSEIDTLVKRFVPFQMKGAQLLPASGKAKASEPAPWRAGKVGNQALSNIVEKKFK
jgi:WD40 repeat protein